MGKEREVWTSSSTYKWTEDEPAQLGAAVFAPGVAPVLLCDVGEEHWCLRLVGSGPKPKARPKLVYKVPSAKERTELVKWLTTMDHETDMFFDVMAGQLVVRDDLPKVDPPYRSAVELDAKEIRFRGNVMLNAAELLTKLVETQRKISDDIDAGRVPRSEDPKAMREQLYFVIAKDTAWQDVSDALDAADAAGFKQPLLLFARTPKAPPPPKTWVDDVVAEERLAGNMAETLGKLTKEVLADCDDLRAAFALNDTSDVPMADQLIQQLAAAIPKSTCAYDLPVLRSTLWFTLGTPYPHVVLPIRAKPELPDDMAWSEANKHFKP